MTVTIERSQTFPFGLVDVPSMSSIQVDAAGGYLFAALCYRNVAAPITIAAPTRNGETLAQLATLGIGLTPEHIITLWGIKNPSTGTHDLVFPHFSDSGYHDTAGVVIVASRVDQATPLGTIATQENHGHVGTGWVNPSLSPSGTSDGLFLSFLGLDGWDADYNDEAGNLTGITANTGQTGVTDVHGDPTNPWVINDPRIIVTSKPGASSDTLGYDVLPHGAYAFYAHIVVPINAGTGALLFLPEALGLSSLGGLH